MNDEMEKVCKEVAMNHFKALPPFKLRGRKYCIYLVLVYNIMTYVALCVCVCSRAHMHAHPLTEMSNKNRKTMFLGSRAQPVRRADNLTAICVAIV
jgi:hypothetical protein